MRAALRRRLILRVSLRGACNSPTTTTTLKFSLGSFFRIDLESRERGCTRRCVLALGAPRLKNSADVRREFHDRSRQECRRGATVRFDISENSSQSLKSYTETSFAPKYPRETMVPVLGPLAVVSRFFFSFVPSARAELHPRFRSSYTSSNGAPRLLSDRFETMGVPLSREVAE
jgi:hypothetical protein